MGTVAVVCQVLGALAFGLGSFLYNDGYGEHHKLAGTISSGVGFAGLAASWAVFALRPTPGPKFDCGPPDYICPRDTRAEADQALGDFAQLIFVTPLIDVIVLGAAGLLGFALARVSSRRPTDGRPPKITEWDA